MSNNWYNTDSWYSPLEAEEPVKSKSCRKGDLTPSRVAGLIALLIVLIVSTSLVFAGGKRNEVPPVMPDPFSPEFDEELPDDWEDFFAKYFQKAQSTVAEINIPQAELPIDFKLELKEQKGPELSLQQIYADCSPSIVAISGFVEGMNGYNWGTGVVLSEDGLILTNTHVINECDSAKVTLSDNSVYEAKLVGADVISDIAVLKIEADGLAPAVFGDSAELSVGDQVAAIGNPLGETFRSTLTDGIISAIERGINHNGHSMSLLQTNTAINEGNSGGALFNMHGQVIGITNMKMMSSYSSVEGIGFAIPSGTVKSMVESIVRSGKVEGRPSIGITVGAIPENAVEHYDIPEGLYISTVSEGSDAEKQGMHVGDIVIEVNAIPVKTTNDVNRIKEGLAVGDSMHFKVWRKGEILEFDVKLMDTNDVYNK